MLESLLAVLAGLLIGSFLNVCIYRMPRDLSVVSPRSHCPACEAPIAWFDNVPLLSYAVLGGRCRACRVAIPIRYPLVELITAGLFFAIVSLFGFNWAGARLCVFAALNIGLAFCDLEQRILPETFTLGGIPLGLLLNYAAPQRPEFAAWFLPASWGSRWLSVAEGVLGSAVASGLLWSLATLYRKIRHRDGMGLGDVSMIAMVGAFLGLYGAVCTLMLASVMGSVLGLVYIYATHKDASSYELPFGSFLATAAVTVGWLISSRPALVG